MARQTSTRKACQLVGIPTMSIDCSAAGSGAISREVGEGQSATVAMGMSAVMSAVVFLLVY
jgi:hypothetical protein